MLKLSKTRHYVSAIGSGFNRLTVAINQITKTTIAEQASLQQEALFD
ncbi:hypothetical protein ACLK19_11000 [Escherichia coli]